MQYGKSQEAIDRLTAEQRRVTQAAGTERPFTGEYNDHTEPGIYVDIVRAVRRLAVIGFLIALALLALTFVVGVDSQASLSLRRPTSLSRAAGGQVSLSLSFPQTSTSCGTPLMG